MLLSGPDQLGGNRQAVLTEQGVPNAASHDKRVVESENQAGIHRAVHQILDLLARSDNEAEFPCLHADDFGVPLFVNIMKGNCGCETVRANLGPARSEQCFDPS
eukprot:3936767-Rhodomonas_salina.2